jgi:hypothetical protein
VRRLTALLAADPHATDAALERADELLRDSLTPQQHAAYRSRGYVEVPSRLTPGRVYRVDGWRPVAVYEGGQFVGAVCIRARESLPGPDVLLARKLMIEGAEDEFLRAGNWLQPAWRPVGVIPTIFLIVALLSSSLMHLQSVGPWALLIGAALAVSPLVVLWFRRRR